MEDVAVLAPSLLVFGLNMLASLLCAAALQEGQRRQILEYVTKFLHL